MTRYGIEQLAEDSLNEWLKDHHDQTDIPVGIFSLSIAISLKRIADALESPPTEEIVRSTDTLQVMGMSPEDAKAFRNMADGPMLPAEQPADIGHEARDPSFVVKEVGTYLTANGGEEDIVSIDPSAKVVRNRRRIAWTMEGSFDAGKKGPRDLVKYLRPIK